mmetsp:Transcript_121063/g.258497  ORF Transcript_121063/g.258497 Transcript_121063/m.258497 type:complete len:181 (+) Transcript_121063:83-625(+)
MPRCTPDLNPVREKAPATRRWVINKGRGEAVGTREWRPLFSAPGFPYQNDKTYLTRSDIARQRTGQQQDARRRVMAEEILQMQALGMGVKKVAPLGVLLPLETPLHLSASPDFSRFHSTAISGYNGHNPGFSDGSFALGCTFRRAQTAVASLRHPREAPPLSRPSTQDAGRAQQFFGVTP